MHCKVCQNDENIVKSGIIRGQQRYYCKKCGRNFTLSEAHKKVSRKSHQTTIIDIAKQLGIAPSTVSRALNNKGDINEKTREIIVNTAKELDYKPNLLAQSLNKGETHTIGVIIPNIERPFFAGVLAGIQHVANAFGYRVMICQSNETYQVEVENVQALLASRVDGLLISHSITTINYDYLKNYIDEGFPIVHYDRVTYGLNTSKVIQSDYLGSFEITEHLIQQKCKRIAILTGPKSLLISNTRLNGYMAALAKYEIPVDESLIYIGDFGEEKAIEALEYWLDLPTPPDAIFSVFYKNSIDMMIECKKMGIKIPEQIAFAGFGNELLAELFEPALTVYKHSPFAIGETAAQILIEHIKNKTNYIPFIKTISGNLVKRASSMKITD